MYFIDISLFSEVDALFETASFLKVHLCRCFLSRVQIGIQKKPNVTTPSSHPHFEPFYRPEIQSGFEFL